VLTADYAAETAHASDLAAIFAQTPFDAPAAAPVLKSLYTTETATPEAMYGVLNSAYTNPALTASLMAQALAAAPYAIGDVAPVLKTHFASSLATAEAMYALLVGPFTTPAPTAAAMAGGLARSPYPATEVAPVLKSHYAGDAGTAAKLAPLLKDAYTDPAIDLAGMLAALVVTSFGAYDMAPAVKPLYTPTPQAMGQVLATALQTAAPVTAEQLGVALTAAAYTAGDTAKGILAGVPGVPAGLMAALLLVISDDKLSAALTSAAGFKAGGDSAATAAPKIVGAVPNLAGTVLPAVLAGVFTPPNLALQPLANASVAGFTTPVATDIAEGVLMAFPATLSDALLTVLQNAYTATGKTLTAAQATQATAAAYSYIGAPLSQGAFAGMMVRAMGASATVNGVAAAIVTTYGAAAVPTSIIAALQSGFQGTSVLVDARTASIGVTTALSLTSTQADRVAQPVGAAFNLTRCPNDVGTLALALQSASFSLNSTAAALSAYFGNAWTPQGFGIVGSVYSQPAWSSAVAQRNANATIQQAAPAIYAANQPNAALMIQVLAASYDLSRTALAIQPMASALKAVVTHGQKVYSLNDVSAGMQAQYAPDWTPDQWRQFAAIYLA